MIHKKTYLIICTLLAAASVFAADDAVKNNSTEMNRTLSTAVRENGGEIRVLIMGNSIALHAPAPNIGWTNNWGMAASAGEKDFAHLTISGIEKRTGKKADYRIRNICAMEKGFLTGYVIAKSQAEDISWKPDYVVIAPGENVASFKDAGEEEAWGKALYDLGKVYKEANPAAKIVYRSVFWPNETKHRLAKEAAAKLGAAFADLGSRGNDRAMQAHDAGFSHVGVANHPGDAGMAMQAETILKALITAFHVDPLQGDDSADGLSPAHAWKTWKRFTAVARPGSSLLLKRGCVYALPLPVVAGDSQSPIVYGAYGEGPKPVLEGHIVDLAKPELWKQAGTDIWETDNSVPEVANVIFDDVHCGNMRYSKEELRQKGEWFQDPSGKGPLFIYATENPAKAWRKVELIAAGYGQVLAGKECTYIRLENLVFRKIGTHGIWIKSGASDISIRRCDLTLIGGAIFRADEFSKKYGERFVQRRVRFGNAIETWGDASNIMVEGCRIYDIFDGGFDIQGVDGVASNIVVRNNIFWNCGYDSLDIAHGVRPDNVVFEQNTCWNGGEGWALQGEPRPRYSLNAPDQLGYLCNLENSFAWKDGSISIRKNIFCNAPDSRCFNFGPKPPTGMHLIKVDQNCYFQVNPKDALVQLGTKRFTATEFDAYRKTTGWDTRSVVGNPQFVAPALGDFRLKPDSPAQGLGSQMSLQPE